MKRLHRPDLFCWSVFNERLDIDFNSFLWVRPDGNVLVDPLPMTAHDRRQLAELGGAAWIVVTNKDHVRATAELAAELGAQVAGPAREKGTFPISCDRWLAEGDELGGGAAQVVELPGSKTPGELALWLAPETLISGDLIRSHRAGQLMLLLPQQGLRDAAQATSAVARLLERNIDAVLVGDGFCVFRDGRRRLEELLAAAKPFA